MLVPPLTFGFVVVTGSRGTGRHLAAKSRIKSRPACGGACLDAQPNCCVSLSSESTPDRRIGSRMSVAVVGRGCSAEVVGKDERAVVVVLSQRNAPHADRLGRGASWYQSHHDRLGRRAVAPSGRGVQRHQRIGLGVVGGGASTRCVVLDGSESP